MLANPHNFPSMFKASQLLWAIVLNLESLLISICDGLHTDLITQSHITCLWVNPELTTMVTSTISPGNPWSLSKDSNFLCYKGLFYVPDIKDVWLDILCSYHDHCLAGHPGITKKIKNILCQFNWPQMVTFITDYIQYCSVCHHSKSLHHKCFDPHHFLLISECPWDSISLDFIEGLPSSEGMKQSWC